VAPPSLLPSQTITLQLWGIVRLQLLFFVFVVLGVGNVGLVVSIVLLLVLRFVSTTKFKQFHIEWVLFKWLTIVATLEQNQFVEFLEEHYWVDWAASPLLGVEVLVGFRICPLISLNNKIIIPNNELTFLRGLPRPLPEVGGARCSPSGPVECFCLV
jgi:hypothetical protein